MKVFVRFAFVLLTLCFLAGCYSQTPKPVTYKYSKQQKMQAAHHWDILAEDVAEQIRLTLTQAGYLSQPVYVQPPCGAPFGECAPHEEAPFGEGFYDLMLTHLVNKNINVAIQREKALLVKTKAQVVYHREKRLTRHFRPGLISGVATLAAGLAWVIRDARVYGGWKDEGLAWTAAALTGAVLWDTTTGMSTKEGPSGVPHSEVIITTSIRDYNAYLMRKTDIYYINDADYWHYQTPPPVQIIDVRDS